MRDKRFWVGLATILLVFWVVRTSNIIPILMASNPENGRVGNPAVFAALTLLYELIVAIGAGAIVVFTGLWKLIVGAYHGYVEDAPITAVETDRRSYVIAVLENKELPPQRKQELQQALLVAVELKDWKLIIRVSEELAQTQFWPREKGKSDV